ncbi:caspase family protein [Bradyrhizobium sp. 956_D2_N1_5]|uniref:caspase family protein n=1 Tax=unclassified Bradyrhizobium TaxID=2631580 RepID=UPI003F24D28A
MRGRHHVLLIGIDAYDGGGMLTGCVNDIDVIQRLLIDRVGVRREQIRRLAAPRTGDRHETDVPESVPTLANMRAELTRLGGDEVNAYDHVFIYYSGHGTQCLVECGDKRRFSREALLPRDKKSGAEYRLLFDWELNALIARIASRTPAVTMILDCCCSAGATRDMGSTGDRFFPTGMTYEVSTGTAAPIDPIRGVAAGLGSIERCQVVAACRDVERARESVGEGKLAYGELTRALSARLTAVPDGDLSELRWGRIWRDIEASVRAANSHQSPWLFGSFGRRVFGFGTDEVVDQGYAIVRETSGYRLDVGRLAGVTPGAEIGVYGPEPPSFRALASPEDIADRKGTILVTDADRATCTGVAMKPFELPEAPRGRLVSVGDPDRLQVALSHQDQDLTKALARSSLVKLVQPQDAELTLVRFGEGWALVDDVHGAGDNEHEPVLAAIPSNRLDLAREVVEHYRDYQMPIRMARTCRDLPGLLRLWLLDCGDKAIAAATAQDPDLPQLKPGERAPYEIADGGRVAIVAENEAETKLWVSLFDCAASGRVLLLGVKDIPKRSKHVFWLNDTLGDPFVASLAKGRELGVERIVAIGTTRPGVSLNYLERHVSFDHLLDPTRRRDADERGSRVAAEPQEVWTSAMTALRVIRA